MPVMASQILQSQKLLSLLNKLTANFPTRPHPLRHRTKGGDVILLTGTTGGFGSNILGRLCSDTSVAKVFALNRRSSKEGLESRQRKAMEQRGIPEECISSPKFELVEAELSQSDLGLNPALYAEISSSITHIIHNAWDVKVVKPIEYFEGSLQGLKNLIDLALASPFTEPPKFFFISTIYMLRNFPGELPALEEPMGNPSVAIGSGYAESKWVAERTLIIAKEKTGLPTTSIRTGILCGDRNGHWNTMEVFPLIVKTGSLLNCICDVGPGLVSWLPTWEAAGVLCAMRHVTEPVLHLVNPTPIPGRQVIEEIARELGVPVVPFHTWLSLLVDSEETLELSKADALRRDPTIALLPSILASNLADYKEPIGLTRLDTQKAVSYVPRLKDIRIDLELGKKWVEGWRRVGFLPPKPREVANLSGEKGPHGLAKL